MKRLLSTVAAPSKLQIYGFQLSQPTRSVLMLCHGINIDYDMVIVNALKGDNRKADYLQINPAGLVPAIWDTNGFKLGESGAILQYLAESRNAVSWYPHDSIVRARINFWMHWHHHNTRTSTLKILVPTLLARPGAADVISKGQKQLAKSLKFMDSELSSKNYLAGSEPSLADLFLITELDQLNSKAFALLDFSAYPSVVKWMDRAAGALPAYDRIFEPVIQAARATPPKQ